MKQNAKTVVARIARNRTAHGFNLITDLFSRACFCAFEQRLRHQSRDAVRLWRFRQQSAAKNCAYRNERQTCIFAHQNAQAIRKIEFLDLARRDRLRGFRFRGE